MRAPGAPRPRRWQEGRGEPWGGAPGAKRGRGRRLIPETRPRSTRPAHTPAAREAPRAPPHVGPHGLADPAPDWSPFSQSEGAVSRGRDDWQPRAGRGRGRGSLLFFPPLRGAPHLPLPASRHPHPEPGLRPPGSWWGAAGHHPTSLQNGHSGGPAFPQPPTCSHAGEGIYRLTRGLWRA